MKKREFDELKISPRADLLKFLEEGRSRLRELKFNLAAGKVKNVAELRMLRRDIARAATLLRLKERENAGEGGGSHK